MKIIYSIFTIDLIRNTNVANIFINQLNLKWFNRHKNQYLFWDRGSILEHQPVPSMSLLYSLFQNKYTSRTSRS